MNFRLFASTLVTAALFLTACGSAELSDPLTREYETYTGTFTSLGTIKVSSTATHLFETKDGDVLYAYSDRYDLDEYSVDMEAYGVVTTYTELDKPLFEVTRLTEASETTTTTEEVKKVEYRNPDLGVVTQIYSNWKIETNPSSGLISFSIPVPYLGIEPETTEPTTETPTTPEILDTIDLVAFTGTLTLTSESTTEEKSSAIKNYVIQNYQDLDTVTPDSITVGTDKLAGLRYKTAVGDVYVFVTRGADLFELSYHYLHMDDALRIQNTNLFSAFLNDFRFIPSGETVEPTETTTSDDVTAPTVTQVEFSKFATLTSNPFQFTMSYPAAWYFAGGSLGYSFSDKSLDDVNAEVLMKLEFNTGAVDGTVRNGDLVSITKKVESRTYTLTGSAEYETAMRTMLDSIQTTKAE